MKTIGLVGGTGWASSADYYRIINEETNQILKGHQFARCVLFSMNFGDIIAFNKKNDDEGVYALIRDGARKLIRIGAEGIVLCANTLHKFAGRLEKEITQPIIHIADATAHAVKECGIVKAGLIGTRYTMELNFYTDRLKRHGIEPIVPNKEEREFLHDLIMDDLVIGRFEDDSRTRVAAIIDGLKKKGAEGIILGCTEFPLLLRNTDLGFPAFDTAEIHARAAVHFALDGQRASDQ